ncbi:hypothetical protein Tco_1074511 [Tanacetum coccineum]
MTVPTSPKEPTKKLNRVKRPAKKSTNAPTADVVIRDSLGVSVSKKITPAKADRGIGIKLLSDASLLEESQIKKTLKKSKQETHKLQASGSSEGADFESEVPDESKAKSSYTNEGTGVNPGVPDVSNANSSERSENDDDSGNDAQDSKRTYSDEEENLNLNPNVYEEEETQEEEYIHTTDYFVPTDKETDDENIEFDDEKYDDLYKDVNMRSQVAEHEDVWKGDVEMTDATRESGSQEKSYEQVVEDAHVTLTTSQKTEWSKQSSSVSSDFASKFLILDNVPPVVDEVASMMNVKSTPTPEPTTELSTNLIPALPDFSSLFGFDHRVSTLENELSQLKQVDHSTQILTSIRSQISEMVDGHLSTRIGFATQTTLQSYTTEFEKKAQEEKDRYIDLVEKSIKDIIKDEVKSQLPQILPKEVSDFATPVIQSAINESLENNILAKSSSQPKSTYEAATSLTEDRDDKDKNEGPSAGSDQGLKKRKKSKDAKPTKGLKTKESKSSSSKGTKSQSKSSGKSAQAEEPEFEVADSDMPHNQKGNLEPKEPTDPDWNVDKTPQQGPTQSWLMTLASTADKPSKTFDELMSTPIDFSTYIMNDLKITNLTQETLLGPAFKHLKGARTNFAELECDFEECYKALSDKLD